MLLLRFLLFCSSDLNAYQHTEYLMFTLTLPSLFWTGYNAFALVESTFHSKASEAFRLMYHFSHKERQSLCDYDWKRGHNSRNLIFFNLLRRKKT